MSRKHISVSLRVPADEGVTPKMIQNLLINHLYFAFSELEGGTVYWDQVKIFCADGEVLEPKAVPGAAS